VVSRYARQHVTVALSGDGGDEMFAGYPVFQWGQTVDRLARAPSSVLSVGAALAGAVGGMPLLENWGLLRQARKAMDLATIEDRDLRFRAIHRLFSPGEVAELLAPGLAGATTQRASERLAQLPSAAEAWSPLRRMMHMRLQQELPNDMLIKVDRMSMAASLEVRAPFLDPEVADVSGRLPDELLIQGGVGKYVLRQAMRRHLPDEVFAHPKRGFSIPLHRFVNDRYRRVVAELLGAEGPLREIVRDAAVQRIVGRGLTRMTDAADMSVYQATHQLWALLQLAAWVQRFGVAT
jgi:asparagine synthase (glutamine-hydrolysing)